MDAVLTAGRVTLLACSSTRDYQSVVTLVIGVVALGCEIFAFVDALRHPENAYVAASKRTKRFWLLITGVALVLGSISVLNPIGLLGLASFMGAAVYLADVRPALRQVGVSGVARTTAGWALSAPTGPRAWPFAAHWLSPTMGTP